MSLYLEVTEGLDEGARFRLRAGLRLGRTRGEILIQDPKVSSLHAKIEMDSESRLILVDQDSSNGLYLNGEKVRRLALLPGVKFRVGRTYFQVVEGPAAAEPDLADSAIARPSSDSWKETLREAFPTKGAQNRPTEIVEAFQPFLKIETLEGPQSEKIWRLGFGPRQVGADTTDIELEDPLAPPLAFEIVPKNGRPWLQATSTELLLNDQPVSPKTPVLLEEGDLLRLGKNLFRIEFEP